MHIRYLVFAPGLDMAIDDVDESKTTTAHHAMPCYDSHGKPIGKLDLYEVSKNLFLRIEEMFDKGRVTGVKFFRSTLEDPIKPYLWRTPGDKRLVDKTNVPKKGLVTLALSPRSRELLFTHRARRTV